jgi:hypothetical protein
MSFPLLSALTKCYNPMETPAIGPAIIVPSELDFMPGSRNVLESVTLVLTYAVMLRHQECLQALRKAHYKLKVVDKFLVLLWTRRSAQGVQWL